MGDITPAFNCEGYVQCFYTGSPHGLSSFVVAFDHGEKQRNKEHAVQNQVLGLQASTFVWVQVTCSSCLLQQKML